MKTQSKEKRALMLAGHDVIYILEPMVDRVMAEGSEGKPLFDAVAASAERVLRNSLTDAGLPVNVPPACNCARLRFRRKPDA